MRVAKSVSIGLAIAVMALPALARQTPSQARTVLADLRQETGDTSTRLVIAGSAKPIFTSHSPDPLTLVVDIADADSSRLPARLEVATREVESLRVSSLARGDGRTTARVEVRLAALAPYTVQESGNDLVITVSRSSAGRTETPRNEPMALPAPPPPLKTTTTSKSSVSKPTPVSNPVDAAPKATRISGVTPLSGGRVGYHVDGNGTLKPETFFLKNPNRLVVDFPDVVTARGQALPGAMSPVRGLRLAQFSAAPPRVARLVLEVDGTTPYHVVPDSTGASIIFGAGAPPAPALLGAPAQPVDSEPSTPVVHREPVSLESMTSAQGPTLAPLPAPAESAPVVPSAPAMKPAIRTEPIAQAPVKLAPKESQAEPSEKFTGHPISLDFKDGDIIDLFRLMSEISGLNIIVNPGISGKVSLTIKEVPWDQALDLILKTNGLGYTLDGNVVRIARLADLQKEEQEARSLRKEKELSGEQTSWQGRLSYLDTEQVKAVVEKTVLSDRGTFTAIGSSPVFIVRDLPERVAAAQKLVLELDRPSAQVEIESRIVVTSRNFSRSLGVQWGFLNQQTPQYGNTTNLAFPNSIIVNGQAAGGDGDLQTLPSAAGIGQAGRGYMVNLPAAGLNTGIGISMGNILGSFNLDAALSAAESSGKARIISTPRITTQNKVAAEIKQGVQIPYQTVSNGTVTVSFKDAGLSMKVTPQITDAGTVFMQVIVENSSPDFGRVVGTGAAAIPPINTQSAQTSVLVKDGATTVIGGIYQGQETTAKQNTPFLSQIPILGMLFKNSNVQNTNNELLIFITPRIVR
jgi:type IV pilus assembly protein PilQ